MGSKGRLGLETLTAVERVHMDHGWCVSIGLAGGSSRVSADKNYLLQTVGKGSY